MMRERFVPVIPIHAKMLERLIAQKLHDPYGLIGWAFPREEWPDALPAALDQLWKPLMDRAMVEDGTALMGSAGMFFVRITPLGEKCRAMGLMHMAPRAASATEIEGLAKEAKIEREQIPEATP
jgi:hypothetical protein